MCIFQAQAQFAQTTAPMPAITEGTYQPQAAAADMPGPGESFSHCFVPSAGLQSTFRLPASPVSCWTSVCLSVDVCAADWDIKSPVKVAEKGENRGFYEGLT